MTSCEALARDLILEINLDIAGDHDREPEDVASCSMPLILSLRFGQIHLLNSRGDSKQ